MSKKTNKYLSANVILPEDSQGFALLLGDCNSAVDLAVLKPNKVQTIISIGLQAKPAKNKLPEDVIHYVYDIHDNKQQKLPVQLLDQVCGIIEEGRKKGGVLVHCYAGVSRSSSFVIAYLINKQLLSYDQAKEKAKKRRPCVHPGDGFIRQLQHYAKVIAKRQQDRLSALQKIEKNIQEETSPVKSQSIVLTERTKRGVRGAVRSAQYLPEGLKSSVLSKSKITSSSKIQEKEQHQNQKTNFAKIQENTDSEKLPPIHRYGQQRFKPSSSRVEMRESIEKIQGKQPPLPKGASLQKIYGPKAKVM